MAYPVILGIIGFVVLNVLVIFFVPRFEPIFKKLEDKGEMPSLTVALVASSHFLRNYGVFLAAAAVVAWIVFSRWTTTDSGRLVMDKIWLKAPGVGKIVLAPGAVALHAHSRNDVAQRHSDLAGAADRQGLDR